MRLSVLAVKREMAVCWGSWPRTDHGTAMLCAYSEATEHVMAMTAGRSDRRESAGLMKRESNGAEGSWEGGRVRACFEAGEIGIERRG